MAALQDHQLQGVSLAAPLINIEGASGGSLARRKPRLLAVMRLGKYDARVQVDSVVSPSGASRNGNRSVPRVHRNFLGGVTGTAGPVFDRFYPSRGIASISTVIFWTQDHTLIFEEVDTR